MQEPGCCVVLGQSLLKNPQGAGVLAQRDPVITRHIQRELVAIGILDPVPPSPLNTLWAQQQLKWTLVQRSVALHVQPQRLPENPGVTSVEIQG